jgi:hypothetical protein
LLTTARIYKLTYYTINTLYKYENTCVLSLLYKTISIFQKDTDMDLDLDLKKHTQRDNVTLLQFRKFKPQFLAYEVSRSV